MELETITFPIRMAQATIHHARAQGLDIDSILSKSGIPSDLLEQADARVTAETLAILQVETMAAMDDEGLGYHRIKIPLGTWAMMCKAVIHSDSLGHAVSRYCRFFSLFDFSYQPVFCQDDENAVIMFKALHPEDPVDPFPIERAMFRCHRFLNWLLSEDIPLIKVNFSFDRPENFREYSDIFLGADVVFGHHPSSIVISKSFMRYEIKQTPASLTQYLRQPALKLLVSRYGSQSWTSRILSLFKRSISEEHDLQHVSDRLAIHPQTLRRRLHQEGTSFKEIKDRARRDIALYHLGHNDSCKIDDIAFYCGFSEASAFIRAFRRWTGTSPSAYKNHMPHAAVDSSKLIGQFGQHAYEGVATSSILQNSPF